MTVQSGYVYWHYSTYLVISDIESVKSVHKLGDLNEIIIDSVNIKLVVLIISIPKVNYYLDWMTTPTEERLSRISQWFENPQAIVALRNKLNSLAAFARINESIKCVIAHSDEEPKDHKNIATFKLYTDNEEEFDIPSKPRRLSSLSQTQNSVQLKWVEPSVGASNVTSYVVTYHKEVQTPKDKSAKEGENYIKKESTTCSITIDKLVQGSVYMFIVQAKCVIGLCESSSALRIEL